ncbi:MAG: toprim domain-containing protein, partial [Clostridia bacterium]|nr:toprim domain-containing protein [Clostridia bacterium]
MTAAFLCKKGEYGLYEIFKNRVMVPIIDIRGNVIAFGGRVLDDSKPKYVNTSDTLAFKKSRNLFALNFAKSVAADELILCEGYMDVIAMHQAGFTNAVAALGTAFGEEHANLLARYTRSVVLLFDSDEAGQKAAKRAIDILRPTGVNIRVVSVPSGKDPDEFLKNNSANQFREILDKSASDTEYKLLGLAKQYDISKAEGKTQFLSEAAKLLSQLEDLVEAEIYSNKLADDMGVQRSVLWSQVENNRLRRQRKEKKTQIQEIVRKNAKEMMAVNPDAQLYPRAANAEEKILGLLLLHNDYVKSVTQWISPEQFVTAFNKGLYELIVERSKQNLLLELSFLAEDFEENEMAYITKMLHSAQLLSGTKEELKQFVDVLIEESQKRGAEHPETMTDEEIMEYMQQLKNQQKGKTQ